MIRIAFIKIVNIRNSWSEEDKNVNIVVMNRQRGKAMSGPSSSTDSASTSESQLQILISKWCQATGLPMTVTVHIEDRCYKLHKYPLVSRSGFMKKKLSESLEIRLPDAFPGGVEIFEIIVKFFYGSSILIDPLNVAALRCAAEFLEITNEVRRGNLCERSDLYLTQVVLQSWEDTLIVLQKCQCLLPLAEDLLIVSRCIESLAFLACMEVFDPEHRRTKPGMRLVSDISSSLRDATAKDWWVKDLLALPFKLFERIIASIRKKGMKEKFVSPVIIMYANKWILSNNTHVSKSGYNSTKCTLLEGIIKLLPLGRRSNIIPVHFLFSLLSLALKFGSSNESKVQLQARIASQLDLATIEDFVLPVLTENSNSIVAVSPEVETMESIVSLFISQEFVNNRSNNSEFNMVFEGAEEQSSTSTTCGLNKNKVSVVASLWDEYLAQIALDASLSPNKFSDLIEIIPASARCTHDILYKAVDTYLMAHPHISQQERLSLCKSLNCQKLSQGTCIHAVQNELMPLRMIVQAMFVQQLHTRQVLRSNNSSTRFDSRFSEPSSRAHNYLSEELKPRAEYDEDGLPLGLLLKRDAAFCQSATMKAEFEATSFRLKNLEQELSWMKKNIQESKDNHAKPTGNTIISSGKSESFRMLRMDKHFENMRCRKDMGISTCTGAGKWISHRSFVHKILEALHKYGARTGFGNYKNNSKSDPAHSNSRALPCSTSKNVDAAPKTNDLQLRSK